MRYCKLRLCKWCRCMTAMVMAGALLTGGIGEAESIPGVDEPYDPANYYSEDSISYADSAPSSFALEELMRGDVYDHQRHLKSIDFTGQFGEWLDTLAEETVKKILDMLGLGDKGRSVLGGMADGRPDFGMPVWPEGDGLFLSYSSQWLRISKEGGERFPWMAKVYQEGIENARLNQEDMGKRMELMNRVLENSLEAEGNMAAIQADTEMQGLMNEEVGRRNRLLANLGLVQGARDKLRLDKDRRAMVAEEKVMTFRIRDRNNMTEQDRGVELPEGKGFRDF